ncbi:hypothetical protein KEM52_005699, partial [Ascosphaera acerosa]
MPSFQDPTQLLLQLRRAQAQEERLDVLRSIRLTLIGNNVRKEAMVRADVLGAAALIIGMLANGGAAFIYPIFAAGCIPLLVSMLAIGARKLRLAVLETLESVANNLPMDYERTWPAGRTLADAIFSQPAITHLVDILQLHSKPPLSCGLGQPDNNVDNASAGCPRCFVRAADLISKICLEPHHKIALGRHGAVDALAHTIASFVVAQGLVLPGAERFVGPSVGVAAGQSGVLGYMPRPAREDPSVLCAALRAVRTITAESRARSDHFLAAPAIKAVFPMQACRAGAASAEDAARSTLGRPAGWPAASRRNSATVQGWARPTWAGAQRRASVSVVAGSAIASGAAAAVAGGPAAGPSWDSKYPNPIDALLPPFTYEEPSDSPFPSLSSAAEMQQHGGLGVRVNASVHFGEEAELNGLAGRTAGAGMGKSVREVKEESPFVSWLIYLVKNGVADLPCANSAVAGSGDGDGGATSLRLAAAALLTELFSLGLVKNNRLPIISVVVMSTLVPMFVGQEGPEQHHHSKRVKRTVTGAPNYTSRRVRTTIDAISVLARLSKSIRDRKETPLILNHEAKLIKAVRTGLQRTFIVSDEAPAARSVWNPDAGEAAAVLPDCARPIASSTACGPAGPSTFTLARLKAREDYLLALTNLAVYEEENRMELVDRETLKCIINSMKAPEVEGLNCAGRDDQGQQPAAKRPSSSLAGDARGQKDLTGGTSSAQPTAASSSTTATTATGTPAPSSGQAHPTSTPASRPPSQPAPTPESELNSHAVLRAACMAARALCRSPRLTRTSLKEAEISKPAIKLLKHPHLDIKLATTALLCNLTLDFSPMKAQIVEEHALPRLCAQARSGCLALRIESLWALKHIVLEQADNFRVSVLQELGASTVLDALELESRGLVRQRENGEPVSGLANLLAVVEDGGQEEDQQHPHLRDLPQASKDLLAQGKAARERLSHGDRLVLDADVEYVRQTRKEQMELVEQAIDFVRNLICGGGGCAQVLNHLVAQWGLERLCSLLAQQLS